METLLTLWQKQWIRYVVCVAAGAAATTLIYPSVSKHSEEADSLKKKYEQQLSEQTSKSEEERQLLEQSHQAEMTSIRNESSKKEEDLTKKMNSLVQENSSLKKQTRTTVIEKTFPDGTMERRTVSEETMETVTERVAEVKEESEKRLREETAKLEEQHQKQTDEIKSSYENKLAEAATKIQHTEELLTEAHSKSESLEKNQRKFGLGVGYNSDRLYKVHGQYAFWGPVFVGGAVDTNGGDKNRAALSLGINF